MALPFTVEQFYGVFRDYNAAIWPAQWFLVALALVAVWAVLRPRFSWVCNLTLASLPPPWWAWAFSLQPVNGSGH